MLSNEGYGLLPIKDADIDILDSFDCGKPHLNGFLTTTAREMHEGLLSSTSLVFHQDFDGLVGYFTLSHDGIPLSTGEEYELGYNGQPNLSSFPAVKIGRLAISKDIQKQGVGTAVMGMIRGDVIGAKSLSAARILVVDAENDPDVIRFYERYGFERSQWADKQAKNHGGRASARPFTVKMIRDVLKP